MTYNDIFLAAYVKALEDALAVLDKISMSIDVNDREFQVSNIAYFYLSSIFMSSLIRIPTFTD